MIHPDELYDERRDDAIERARMGIDVPELLLSIWGKQFDKCTYAEKRVLDAVEDLIQDIAESIVDGDEELSLIDEAGA